MGAGLLVFTNQVQRFFALKKGATDWRYDMTWPCGKPAPFSDEQIAVIKNACEFALGGRRDTLVCGRKTVPQCTGAD